MAAKPLPFTKDFSKPSIFPSGWYEVPSTGKTLTDEASYPVSKTNSLTHISLVVKVPVLSEHIIVVHPNVYTFGNFLTIALYLAILLAPSAKHVVITAGKPSGIAATAKATATLK